jgi:cold shock CspA family protein
MRGAILRVSRKSGSGCILAEDGKEVCFERSEASHRADDLRVGNRVEFELQYGFERPCAVNIKKFDDGAAEAQEHL